MVTVVLVVNLLIGLGCLVTAWYLWLLKGKLARFTERLIAAERAVHHVLEPAPQFVRRGQTGTSHLRRSLDDLAPQVQRMQQVMALIGFSQIIWRRYFILASRSNTGVGRSRGL